MKHLVYGLVGIVLLFLSGFFAWAVAFLFRSEVWPAMREGNLSIETNTMVLNVLWEGNEIYALLAAYLMLAGALAYGAIRAFRATIN